jgi:hypothetical protein
VCECVHDGSVCLCVFVRARVGMRMCVGVCVCRYMRKTEYRVRLLRKPRDGVQLHVTLAAHYRPSAAESVSYGPPPTTPKKKIF